MPGRRLLNVENDDRRACADQRIDDGRTNAPGTAGDNHQRLAVLRHR